MSTPNAAQQTEITYVSGLTASGTVAAQSFATWNGDTPATYGTSSDAAKWGSSLPGTGGTVTVAFDTASAWTAAEQAAFLSAMHLWSDVANIQFTLTADQTHAGLVISRGSDKRAYESLDSYRPSSVGSARTGTIFKSSISIDTTVRGFGPLAAGFSTQGGYPWMTAVHELGHALGLGHAGPYNAEGTSTATVTSLGSYDNRAWTLMSYANDDSSSTYPVTPMVLDVAAIQRIYGVATNSPLSSGGQVFGFHSNIQGDTHDFFDFGLNTRPFVTIWDGGSGNTLDLSGFSTFSQVSLVDGSLNSVAGLYDNLGIAFGTRIETLIGGSGSDTFTGNALNDYLMGGGGSDFITGGSGNDHIYGNMATSQQGAVDGNDTITTGGGDDYVNGNAGDDTITAPTGNNRLYGGAGNDTITAGSGNNHINGNLGNDLITVGSGNNTIMGGQGDDVIRLGSGNNVASGDLGNDRFVLGTGYAFLSGGAGTNSFDISTARIDRGGVLAGYVDEITDFKPGTDLLYGFAAGTAVLHGASGQSFASVAAAQAAAQLLLIANGGFQEVAAMQVGSDTYLFWDQAHGSDAIDSGLKLDGVTASSFGTSSLTTDYALTH